MHINFNNTYAHLPERFSKKQNPAPVAAPKLIRLNRDLALELGLDADDLTSSEGVNILAGNIVPSGAEPIALAYAGHQFGHFVPQLGDGRAVLLGEILDKKGKRYDIQLKGSGPTAFSRQGDGRAALGPVLREYLISEAMCALGVPTTRSLAATLTGDKVLRETILPGAVLTRIATSHIRIGTFEFFAAQGDIKALGILADYVIQRHYPLAAAASNPYLALLKSVVLAQANLVAHWQSLGFIHGVMNTDNMSIAGETIDYGPCAFMDSYDPATVFSSIDRAGRYAYGNQPHIAQWNLARLAETLLPLLSASAEEAMRVGEEAVQDFKPIYEAAFLGRMREKLGLATTQDKDDEIVLSLLEIMTEINADFTLTFRHLSELTADDVAKKKIFAGSEAFDRWHRGWLDQLGGKEEISKEQSEAMLKVNPLYIPRNLLVEEALQFALEDNDFSAFEVLLDVVTKPYARRAGYERYECAPFPSGQIFRTFCGT